MDGLLWNCVIGQIPKKQKLLLNPILRASPERPEMLTDFGRNSFVTWTTGLIERIKTMPDPAYICLSCGKTFVEGETFSCPNCGELSCPACNGEIQSIQKYDEAMKANE